ncbi:hypothetical protein H4CHR_02999 [Variovorax sp. PBS-H4]|uniref:hypothetical protein n=1 Tax=Variovorax sp. PBS-H4 TaxID=434008 RepID=UPI0013183FE9|nr:hypothetical protein [Variovorax sp. PBS-H4]VTU32375.1 hypothetical protein H4CHR_02999 [Variovorax sp. PBS-H4]
MLNADDAFSGLSPTKLAAGIAGALVSMKFLQGTWPEKLGMAAGGSALSYFATTPIAEWLSTPRAEGLVGFLVGLFGMAIVSKGYEVIQMLDSKEMAKEAWAWCVRKWKA